MNEHIKKLTAALGLSKKLVGIKLFPDAEAYARFPAPPPKHRLSYCMMIRMAAYGKRLKAEDRHFKCNGARRALGFMSVDTGFASGRHYSGMGLYRSQDKAREVAGRMALLKGPVHGVGVYPLEDFPTEADVVLIICTPYQAMRLFQGYAYHFGIPPQICMVGNQGVCSELTARPLLTRELNASVLCSGTRFACKWADSEMGIGLPFDRFPQLVDGIMETLNPTEPDPQKRRILKRMDAENLEAEIVLGKNYYDSKPGSEKLKD